MIRRTRASFVAPLALLVCACGAHAADVATKGKVPDDRNPQLLLERGKAFAETGDMVRAEQYLAAALAAGADEHSVMPPLLHVCVASRHYRLGVEYAEVVLAHNPSDARLRFLAGALYVSIGDRERAREHLQKAARQLPDDAEVQFSVAVFFRDELSDRAAADPYFRDYLRLAPTGSHVDEARASLMERIE
jgi:tetratricopeptide (TPR) repeat protein